MDSDHSAPAPHGGVMSRLTTLTAVFAVLGALGLTASESAFGSAEAAANAAIQAGADTDTPCSH